MLNNRSKIIILIVASAVVLSAIFALTRPSPKGPQAPDKAERQQVATTSQTAKPLASSSTLPYIVPGQKATPTPQEVRNSPGLYVDIMADDDHDGLTNPWEARYGTDYQKPDTDGDGLTDYEEAMIYFSDPKVVDSDGDGNADGTEVNNGFNPNGEGKLKNASIKR